MSTGPSLGASRPSVADVTAVICARNADNTIGRAVRSALAQGGPVLLVDDWSEDHTADIARRAGGAVLQVVRPDRHRSLGYARLVGTAAVRTPWLQWLDADDALLPGRAKLLLESAHEHRWDAVWDAVELYSGDSDRLIRPLAMPQFMRRPGAAVRLFERNHLPGPAWPLITSRFARRIGYDPFLPTADDLDFMLRGVVAGGQFGFVTQCGYRQYAYPASLSRDRAHQQAAVATVLRKHDYADVRRRYLAAGFSDRIAWWALVSMASFRGEWEKALALLDDASPANAGDEVLEPEGPWPLAEHWRRAFHRGTLLLLLGDRDAEAADELQRAEAIEPTAEGANNLGVALSRRGRGPAAATAFAAAQTMFPGYADARSNRQAEVPHHITVHPLRRNPSRSEY
jgi:glycosyltransferase involved in cell wall biosynthesis